MAAIPLQREVHYPESDGKPMAETELHAREMIYIFEALEDHLRDVPEVYVGIDLLLYYVEGDPKSAVAPDVFVTLGVPRGVRRTYKFWEEGKPPSLVVEVTSSSTRREDLGKKSLYERQGVEEYILHDPLGDYLKPPLQGYRLAKGRYQPIPLETDGSLFSRVTGLRFRPDGEAIRLIDPATGKVYQSRTEADAALRAAEEELVRLRAELDRLRGRS